MQTPASAILLQEAETLERGGRWLVLGGDAALVNGLTSIAGRIDWRPTDVREQAQADPCVVVRNDMESDAYDCVFVPVPPDRALNRRWLLIAFQALKRGGRLMLAGANAEGGKSAVADARVLFGGVAESYRQKHRVAEAIRPEADPEWPAWATEDGVRPGSWSSFSMEIEGEIITLETQPGVFAGARLDAGTQLLLEHLQPIRGGYVLDVGCGVGVLGIVASRRGAGEITLIDANVLAVEAAARNLDRLGISGRALASNVYSGVEREQFDLIVSNPPFHRGKQVDLTVADALIDGAPEHLAPDGQLLIVANAFLAYNRRLERVFRRVEKIAATRQYHVLMAAGAR